MVWSCDCKWVVFLSYSQDSSELCRSRSNTGGMGFKVTDQNGRAASLQRKERHLSFCRSQERDSFLVKNYAHLNDKARGVFMDSGLKTESGSCCVTSLVRGEETRNQQDFGRLRFTLSCSRTSLAWRGISWDLAGWIGFRKWVQLISSELSVCQRDPLTQSTYELWDVMTSMFSRQKG